MKILITGAAGFVGQHLGRFIKQKRKHVVGSYRNHQPQKHIFKQLYRCDFSDADTVFKLIRRTKPTHIFHLVGQSSPSLSWEKPLDTIVDNAFSALYLLEACRRIHIRPRIFLSSSAHVYGSVCKRRRPLAETDKPSPLDPYGFAKMYAENFAHQYWEQFKIPTVIIRATAHVGVGQNPIFAISNFARQIAKIEKGLQPPVIQVGNLRTRRSFIAINDMLNAYWSAMHSCQAGYIYNVSSKTVKPMGEWLSLLLSMSRKRIKVVQEKARLNLIEIPRLEVSSERFRRLTGWRETVSLERVFRDILNWQRQHV